MKKIRFALHVHHNRLMEPLTEPISVRRKYIRENKPKEEVPLRLKLLKEVKGKLPREFLKTWEAYEKAWEAYEKAWEAYDKAEKASDKAVEAYGKACRKHYKEIQALHKKECKNCTWSEEQKTIFPKKDIAR